MSLQVFRTIRRVALTRWTRQLASLLAAGLPIDRALASVAHYQAERRLRSLSESLGEALRAGLSISTAFEAFPRQFDLLYRQMVATGESTGDLAGAFSQIADYREKADRARARLRRAAAYPTVVLVVAVAAVAFLLMSVVPTYRSLYAEFDAQLPDSTEFLIRSSSWLQQHAGTLALSVLAVAALAAFLNGQALVRRWISLLVLRLRPISLIGRPAAWARTARGLGSMLTAGVLLQEALERAKALAGNVILTESLELTADRVAAGESLADALEDLPTVEPIVVQMAHIGEDTGDLGTTLVKAAEFLESEVDQRTETMLTLAEPMLILFVGAVVGLILLALYLPLFDLVSQTG